MDVVRAKLLCKMAGEHKKLTSMSKVDLARLSPSHSALKPTSSVSPTGLYKRAKEPILENPKLYDDGQGWIRTD